MGMVSVVIWKWSPLPFLMTFCNKEVPKMAKAKEPPVFCWSTFKDDTMKIRAFGCGFFFRLHGVFPIDAWHIRSWPANINMGVDLPAAIIIPLQAEHNRPSQWLTASALGIYKFMPNITAKKATINFLDKKFISVKKWNLILQIICHIVVIVNTKHHIILFLRIYREADKDRISFWAKRREILEFSRWVIFFKLD